MDITGTNYIMISNVIYTFVQNNSNSLQIKNLKYSIVYDFYPVLI